MSGVIDVHPHVIADDPGRYPLNPLGGRQSDWSRRRPVNAEKMLAAMDEAGIARSVLVQASTSYGHDNSYVADTVAAQPRRFAGVFSVDMLASDAPAHIRHWMSKGLTGLRVFIAGHTTARHEQLDDPRAFPAWQCAEEAGLPVCVQLRANGLEQLETMLQRFPRIRIALDHMARPTPSDAGRLLALARYPNLFLKLTTHNVRDARQPGFFEHVVRAFGSSRIAWGSNYPASEGSLAGILAEAMQALDFLSAADRDWIFCRTAKSLYP